MTSSPAESGGRRAVTTQLHVRPSGFTESRELSYRARYRVPLFYNEEGSKSIIQGLNTSKWDQRQQTLAFGQHNKKKKRSRVRRPLCRWLLIMLRSLLRKCCIRDLSTPGRRDLAEPTHTSTRDQIRQAAVRHQKTEHSGHGVRPPCVCALKPAGTGAPL